MRNFLLTAMVVCSALATFAQPYNITFQVDMNLVGAAFTTPEVNGTFNGWCGGCNPMSDADGDGVWSATIPLDAGTYEYKFAYDAWAGSENLTEGSPCTVTAFGFTNRALTVSGDATLDVVCWGSCEACGVVGLAQMDLPVTFEDAGVEYGLIGFGGAEASSIVVDPTDAGNTVAKVIKSATAELWAGTTITNGAGAGFENEIPFADGSTTMTVRVWSPDAGIQVRLKVEDYADPTKSVETEATTTVAGEWETLTFDFSNEAPGTAAINYDYFYNKASIFFNFGVTGAAAGEKTYYFDDVYFDGAEPALYNVTFNVNMNDVADPFTLPEVNGTFNGWCGGCNPLSDPEGDGIWTATISLAPGDYQYKFAYDAWAGSENLTPGAACTVTDGGFTNRALTVSGDVNLDVVCWGSCVNCGMDSLYDITFIVDMNEVAAAFTTPEVNGTFNGWCGGCAPMSDPDGDNVWEATISLAAGSYEYKFAYDAWAGSESLTEGDPCTITAFGFTNRTLVVTESTVLNEVCWASCDACDGVVDPTYNIVFHVNMNDVTDAFTTPEVNGTFNGWCGGCAPMTDDNGDNIWDLTIPLTAGFYEYKFAYDTWAGSETLTEGDPCTLTTGGFTNRTLTVTGDADLGTVCWGYCTDCELDVNDMINDENIIIAPNPAKDVVTISLTGINNSTLDFYITDVLGNVVDAYLNVTDNTITVATTDYAAGMYFVYISNGADKVTRNFVVQD